jgi:hypothetical protein
MKNLNIRLSWKVLLPLGLVGHFIGAWLQGNVVTQGIGIAGDLIFLVGLVDFFSSLFKSKKNEIHQTTVSSEKRKFPLFEFLKRNKKVFLVGSMLVVLFFWFEVRPTVIKHVCSWVQYEEVILPRSVDGYTPVAERTIPLNSEDGTGVPIIGRINRLKAEYGFKTQTVTRKATEKEYRFCLGNYGL